MLLLKMLEFGIYFKCFRSSFVKYKYTHAHFCFTQEKPYTNLFAIVTSLFFNFIHIFKYTLYLWIFVILSLNWRKSW